MESIKDRIGPFELIEEISRSSTTSVFKAYQRNLERWVLLKQLHSHLTQEKDIVQRFEREAKAAARIKHENIVDIHDFGLWEDIYYIALEYVEGISLRKVILTNGPLPVHIAAAITSAVLTGLAYAHSKGVFHRDMKPDNILISQTGIVKITDFGLALISDYPSITAQDGIVGTPAYMSPEQANGEDLDARSDIFSLGLTFYEMLTGRRAYDGDSTSACITKLLTEDPPRISAVRPDVPKDIAVVLDRMTKRDVSKRYQTCEQVIRDLSRCAALAERVLTKDDLAAYLAAPADKQTPIVVPVVRTTRRKGYRLFAAAITILTVLLVGAYFLYFRETLSRLHGTGTTPEPQVQSGMATDTSSRFDSDTLVSRSGGIDEQPLQSGQENSERHDAELEGMTQAEERSDTTASKPISISSGANSSLSSDVQGSNPQATIDDIPIAPVSMDEEGILKIDWIPKTDIYIDDDFLGMTPEVESITLRPGLHTLRFENTGYETFTDTITISEGQQVRINFSTYGFLIAHSVPDAKVYLNDVFFDFTPFIKPHIVLSGKYNVRFSSKDCEDYATTITITPGYLETIEKNLKCSRQP